MILKCEERDFKWKVVQSEGKQLLNDWLYGLVLIGDRYASGK
ncbi:hypothetical protein BVRB_2g029830 [Beta vulgaris subsp. vulgaris]|nr:hypothetical protein BVRB_2g029830 [Beta vulgaris subsp. vulgaris]